MASQKAVKTRIQVEITLEELAYISIALDRFSPPDPEGVWKHDIASRLQRKWDKLYRETHNLLDYGVKAIRIID